MEGGIAFRSEQVKASINCYYMDFKNEIIKLGGLDRFGQPVTGNAERTRHLGIELNAEWQILPQLSVNSNFTFSKNELIRYQIYEWGDSSVNAIRLDGNPIAGFPALLGNIRLTYSWFNYYASLGIRHVGKYYTDNFKNEANAVDPYTVLNLTMRYRLDALRLQGLSLQAQVNNLLDKKYLAHGEGSEFFPAATRNVFVSMQYEF
jgi:iron complex outermembrane receptor protein